MNIIDTIFEALGGATAIARQTGDPVQTVHSWKTKGNIPHWRRPAIIAAAQKMGKQLEPELLAYLAAPKELNPFPPEDNTCEPPADEAEEPNSTRAAA
jgi:hypothetical protein